MKHLLPLLLGQTGLDRLPVRIRHGYLRGARWTLWPHSAYLRGHHESDFQTALTRAVSLPQRLLADEH